MQYAKYDTVWIILTRNVTIVVIQWKWMFYVKASLYLQHEGKESLNNKNIILKPVFKS